METTIWGFTKIRGTFLGVPNNKDHSILWSILGSLICGKLPYYNILYKNTNTNNNNNNNTITIII